MGEIIKTISGGELGLKEGEEYRFALSKMEGSAIEYVKLTLIKGEEVNIKEHLNRDINNEDLVVEMGVEKGDILIKIEAKIEGEDRLRKLVEGSISWEPSIKEVPVAI